MDLDKTVYRRLTGSVWIVVENQPLVGQKQYRENYQIFPLLWPMQKANELNQEYPFQARLRDETLFGLKSDMTNKILTRIKGRTKLVISWDKLGGAKFFFFWKIKKIFFFINIFIFLCTFYTLICESATERWIALFPMGPSHQRRVVES